LWSVGAVFFTVLTGADVHEATTASEQLVYAATQPARPIETLAPWLEHDLAAAINRALAFDRAARWPNASAMQQALRATASFAPCVRLRSSAIPAGPSANPAVAPTVDMPDRGAGATVTLGSPARRVSTGTLALDPAGKPGGRPGGR
jgi:hypothetical protein